MRMKFLPLMLALLVGIQPGICLGIELGADKVVAAESIWAAVGLDLAETGFRLIGLGFLTAFTALVSGYVHIYITNHFESTSSIDQKIVEQPVFLQSRDVKYVGTPPDEVQSLIQQIQCRHLYKAMNCSVPRGILLHGDPGCGKTLLARYIASKAGCSFFSANGTDFFRQYKGSGAQAIKDLFKKAYNYAKEKGHRSVIIFIDEFDEIGAKSGSNTDSGKITQELVNTFLSEMDGFSQRKDVDIIILAATNHPDDIDSALLRPGRFDKKIHISFPDEKARQIFIANFLQNFPSEDRTEDFRNILVALTDGMSPAAMQELFNSAGVLAVENRKESRDKESFIRAFFALEEQKRGLMVASVDKRKSHIEARIKQFIPHLGLAAVPTILKNTHNMTLEEVDALFDRSYGYVQYQFLTIDQRILLASCAVQNNVNKRKMQEKKVDICRQIYGIDEDKVDKWLESKIESNTLSHLTNDNLLVECQMLCV